jgi:hypothetical protein
MAGKIPNEEREVNIFCFDLVYDREEREEGFQGGTETSLSAR